MMILILILNIIKYTTERTEDDCSETKPYMCSDGSCVESHEDCMPFGGCLNPSRPFLCANGECALNYSECKEKFFKCEDHRKTKCLDGVCRVDCSGVKHSSCPFNFGYRCPDGKCVKQMIECGCKIN